MNVRADKASGFTLIELILVMALIVIAVSFITPHLANFFKGRTLNSEARQLVALTHQGQSRAISGGVPMVLWIDTQKKSYGLEEEPGYSDKDPDAVEFQIDESLKFDIPDSGAISPMVTQVDSARAGLPQIIFLPDATIDETSPHTVRITGNNNESITITQTRDRNGYEIATTSQ